LEPLGLLKNSDRGVLVAYCEAWSRFVAAVREYHREGVVKLDYPDSGRTGKHAAVAVAEPAAAQLAKLGSLLGLSPVAERGLSITPNSDDDDPFAG
jgi:P27 family predicted phage terminase small subunit